MQDAERRYSEGELGVEMVCAMVNNNVRCYNESMDFAERVEDSLDDDHKVGTASLLPNLPASPSSLPLSLSSSRTCKTCTVTCLTVVFTCLFIVPCLHVCF